LDFGLPILDWELVATVSDFLTVVPSHGAGPMRKGRVGWPEEKLVATVSDFLTVVLSRGAGPMRKGRVRWPEEKTTVRKSLTVATGSGTLVPVPFVLSTSH
jgi:hypothetical protein